MKQSPLSAHLSTLAFKAFGLRIGIEIFLCIAIHITMFAIAAAFVTPQVLPWINLNLWFLACIVVAVTDHIIIAKPVITFRRTWAEELKERYDSALSLLESVGPSSLGWVRCPESLYFIRRAQILTHAGKTEDAAADLVLAELAGTPQLQIALARAELKKQVGDKIGAHKELVSASEQLGKNGALQLEEALLVFEERKNPREAKRAFESVLKLPPVFHPVGESTHNLARGFLEASRLWTGEAEEALEGLNEAIGNLQAAAIFIESLRPMFASLLLERAYYHTTHKEPTQALLDLNGASFLCAFPAVKRRAEEVREEYAYRFKVEPLPSS